MKTESAQFAIDRKTTAGMQPVYLWNFTNASLKLSTISLTVSGTGTDAGIYSPYVLSFDEIDFSLENGHNFGGVGSVRVILARNATTDVFLSGGQTGTPVRVNMGFYKNAALPDADLMPMARFVFGGLSEITQAQFAVTLFADERKLKTLPLSRLTEDLIVPEQNRAVFIPLALGRFNAPTWTVNDPQFRAKGHNYLPCVLANAGYNASNTYNGVGRTDIGEMVVAENKVGSTAEPSAARLFQYLSELDTHVLVNYSTNAAQPTSSTVFDTWNYANTSGDIFLPASINAGRVRLTKDRYMTRLIEAEYSGNTVNDYSGGNNFNWKNLTDDSGNNVTRVQAGQNPARDLLIVRWEKRISPSPSNPQHGYLGFIVTDADKTTGGGTRIRIKHGRVDTGALDSAFSTFDITGATILPIYFSIHYSSGSAAIADTTFGAVGWNWDNIFIRLDVVGITSTTTQYAELATLGLELYYTDDLHTFKKAAAVKFSARNEIIGREKRKGVIPGTVDIYGPRREFLEVTSYTYLASPDTAVFADYTSTTSLNVFTIGWGEIFGAPWMVAAVLGDILGYASTEFDVNQFLKVSNFHQIDSQLAIYIDREWEAADLLRTIAFQGNLILFYSGDGRWKIQPKWRFISYSGQQTPLQFSDVDAAYSPTNLIWNTVEPQYNKFRLLYQFDFARSKYFARLENDQSGAVPNGRPFPDIEGLFIRDYTTAHEWLDLVFIKYFNRRRRVVEFTTSLVASHLELGDFIKVAHNALPDNTPVYQIIQIRYGPSTVFIKAVECDN